MRSNFYTLKFGTGVMELYKLRGCLNQGLGVLEDVLSLQNSIGGRGTQVRRHAHVETPAGFDLHLDPCTCVSWKFVRKWKEILKYVNTRQYTCLFCTNTSSMCTSMIVHVLLRSITPFSSNSYFILFIFFLLHMFFYCLSIMCMCFPFNLLIVFIRYCCPLLYLCFPFNL